MSHENAKMHGNGNTGYHGAAAKKKKENAFNAGVESAKGKPKAIAVKVPVTKSVKPGKGR